MAMDPSVANSYAALGIFIYALGLILAVLWILVPFALFGIKGRLDRLIAEQRRANALLEQHAADMRAILLRTPPA
jgi:hypothetical protein